MSLGQEPAIAGEHVMAGSSEEQPLAGRRRVPVRRFRIGAGLGVMLVVASVFAWRWARPSSGQATAPEPRDVPREDHGAIVISEAYRRRVGVTFGAVERGRLTPVVTVVGTVALDPRRVAAVGTRIPGFVRRVFKLEGDEVRAGEPMAETESAELGQAQATVQSAMASQHAAEVNARREQELLANQLTTAREAEEAEATVASRRAALAAAQQGVEAMGGTAKGPLGVRVLRAPIAGHVVEAQVSVGQSVQAHKLAFRIADLSAVWVELEVFERTVGMVRIGDPVEISPIVDPSHRIPGTVAHVGEIIDVASRSAEVRVHVDNRNGLLRPGQSVSAVIRVAGAAHQTLSVPLGAVTYVDDTPTVFVAVTPDRIVPTKIRIGASDGQRQEVVSGLREADRVVVSGLFALKSELFR